MFQFVQHPIKTFDLSDDIEQFSEDNYWFFTLNNEFLYLYGVKNPNKIVKRTKKIPDNYLYTPASQGLHKIRQLEGQVIIYLSVFSGKPKEYCYMKIIYNIFEDSFEEDMQIFEVQEVKNPRFHPTENALICTRTQATNYLQNIDEYYEIHNSQVGNIDNVGIIDNGDKISYYIIYKENNQSKIRRLIEDEYLQNQIIQRTKILNYTDDYSFEMKVNKQTHNFVLFPTYPGRTKKVKLFKEDLQLLEEIEEKVDDVLFTETKSIVLSKEKHIIQIWDDDFSHVYRDLNLHEHWSNKNNYEKVSLWKFQGAERVVVQDEGYFEVFNMNLESIYQNKSYEFSNIYLTDNGNISYKKDDQFIISSLRLQGTLNIAIIVSVILFLLTCICICCCRYLRNRQANIRAEANRRHQFSEVDIVTFNSSEIDIKDLEEKQCAICLNGDCTHVIPCLHVYHESCIKLWLLKSQICPNCRKPTHIKNVKKLQS